MKIHIKITDDQNQIFEGFAELKKSKKEIRSKQTTPKTTTKNYKGLSGGINFLISQNFFKSPKSAKEIMAELKKEGYYHLKQTVDKALRRDFVTNKKILTRIKEKNIWHYVIRK